MKISTSVPFEAANAIAQIPGLSEPAPDLGLPNIKKSKVSIAINGNELELTPVEADFDLESFRAQIESAIAQAATNLAPLKQRVIAQINDRASVEYGKLLAPYPVHESDTWSYKLSEAEAYLKSKSAGDAPNLSVEASTRGIALATYVQVVVTKAAEYRARCAQIAGTRGRHSDAVDKLKTVEKIQAYDFSQGWE